MTTDGLDGVFSVFGNVCLVLIIRPFSIGELLVAILSLAVVNKSSFLDGDGYQPIDLSWILKIVQSAFCKRMVGRDTFKTGRIVKEPLMLISPGLEMNTT